MDTYRYHKTHDVSPGTAGGPLCWLGLAALLLGILLGAAVIVAQNTEWLDGLLEKLPAAISGDPNWLVLPSMGLAFAGLGLLILSAGQRPGLVFLAVGVLVAVIPTVYVLSADYTKAFIAETLMPMGALCAFLLCGIGLIAIPRVADAKAARIHTVQTRATVTGKEMRKEWMSTTRGCGRRLVKLYYLTWRYYAMGEWRTYKSGVGRSPEPREAGHEGVLWINPNDPADVWEGVDKGSRLATTLMGVGFALFGIAGLAMIPLLR